MIAALRTPRHAITFHHSTTHPSTRISTPIESLNTSPSGKSKVENVISRVLDLTGMRKLNALLDGKRDAKDHEAVNKGSGGDGYKRELKMEDATASMLDLQSALRTIPRENDAMYPESPLLRGLGKAAKILGLDEDERPLVTSDRRASKEEYIHSHSFASGDDDAEVPPGAARRHFCSALTSEDDAHSLFPATRCCWGGHVGPTYLDHTQDIDQVSLQSSIAPSPVKAYKPTPFPSPRTNPPIVEQALADTHPSIAFGYYGRDRTGWARQKPYPYMMERDVEQVYGLAGRDAIEHYSRYPAMPKRQLVN
jgi:hypothetical protein